MKLPRRRFLRLAAGAAALPGPSRIAWAQGLSNRPITIVVPYTPGTGPDVVARTIGDALQKRWHQPIVVDNRAGATGNIGTQMVARAAPDGHTLLLASNPFTANVSLFANVPYDPIRSFAPISDVGAGALALCVNPTVPATNLKEFVAYAKSHQGQLNYASPGVGGLHHLAMELLKLVTHIDIKHVPYRGSAGAAQDIVGGHVTGGFLSLSTQHCSAVGAKQRVAHPRNSEPWAGLHQSGAADAGRGRSRGDRGRAVVRPCVAEANCAH
jgi:tripartite-type tricarboxylate transporter receptor subunit TctC